MNGGMWSSILGSAVVLWAVSGCGGGGSPGQPLHRFPSRASLSEIAAQRRTALPGDKVARVDSWTIAAESGAGAGSEWSRLLSEVAAARQDITLSAELGCAAREIARFYDEHKSYPDERLRSFIVGRCGGSLASPMLGAWTFEAPPSVTDAALISQFGAQVRKQLSQALPAGRIEAALEVYRGPTQATVMLVAGVRLIDLVPRPPLADESGTVTVEGTLATQADALYALINQGPYGYAECLADHQLRLPRFRVRCQLLPGDTSAWLDLLIAPPGRLLTRNAARLLVRASADAPLDYQVKRDAPAPVTNAADFKAKLLQLVNQTRSQAGLSALAAADRQAAMNEKLAPHFFAASLGNEGELADNIALGLMAGWDVRGTIRNGDFYSDFLGGTQDAGDWLGALLEHPQARRALLNPASRQLAVGALVDLRGLGAVLTTYEFFEGSDHRAEEKRLFELISAERARRGLAAPVLVPGVSELGRAVSAIKKGTAPNAAFQQATTAVAQSRGTSVGGWYIETNDLTRTPLPEELWRAASPQLAIAITHYRAPGGAWGQYVIFILNFSGAVMTAADDGQQRNL